MISKNYICGVTIGKLEFNLRPLECWTNILSTELRGQICSELYNNTCSFCIFIGRELCVIKVHTHG